MCGESPIWLCCVKVMYNAIGQRPEVEPVATCSSSGKRTKSTIQQEADDSAEESASDTTSQPGPSHTPSQKKRKPANMSEQLLQAAAKRHEEKLQRYDRFLDLLTKLVDMHTNNTH